MEVNIKWIILYKFFLKFGFVINYVQDKYEVFFLLQFLELVEGQLLENFEDEDENFDII